jgi:hypothetical protein
MKRSITLVLSITALAAGISRAQVSETLVPSNHSDGTVWAQSLAPKESAGSADLGELDLGPPGPGVTGLQATWLQWIPDHLYLGLLGGGVGCAEVTQPPGTGGAPIALCMGAATLDGGWVLTMTAGVITGVAPAQGAFVWTPSKLYLVAVGGGIVTAEVTTPSGSPIAGVQGVSIMDSYIFDYSLTPGTVVPAIQGTALVYSPTNVYVVKLTLSGGVAFSTAELLQPAGGSITSTRGIATLAGQQDFTSSPPTDVQGAQLIWNPGHVFLFTKTPAMSIGEILTPTGAPISSCWGAMKMGRGSVLPTRGVALLWQPGHSWVLTIEPAVTVSEATTPPGGGAGSPIVSNVSVPASGLTPLVEREAGYLYEILGTMLIGGSPTRALILGQDQREP